MLKKHSERRNVSWIDWVFVIVGLLLAVRTGASVLNLWKAGDRLKTAEMELEEARVHNLKLKGQVAEAKSDEFVEREARDKLGLGREGEVILILPQQTQENPKSEIRNPNLETEDHRANWRKWWELYIRI